MAESRIYINIASTQYEIIGSVAESLGWSLVSDPEDEDCDVVWQDQSMQVQQLGRLKCFQRINHFPGMNSIAHKDQLANHLNAMKAKYPQHYNFFPSTWVLPKNLAECKAQFTHKRMFIVKPEVASQACGIFLMRRFCSLPRHCGLVLRAPALAPGRLQI